MNEKQRFCNYYYFSVHITFKTNVWLCSADSHTYFYALLCNNFSSYLFQLAGALHQCWMQSLTGSQDLDQPGSIPVTVLPGCTWSGNFQIVHKIAWRFLWCIIITTTTKSWTAVFEPQPFLEDSVRLHLVFTSLDFGTIILSQSKVIGLASNPTHRTRSLYLFSPVTVVQLYLQALGSLFIAFHNLQGYSRDIVN